MMDNPLAQNSHAWLVGIKLLILAGFSYWLNIRATKQDIFLLLTAAFGINGILSLIFLSGSTVSAFGIILNTIAFAGVFIILSAVFCSKLHYHIPKFGILHEDLFVDPEKGIQPVFTVVASLLLFIILRFALPGPFSLLEKTLKMRGSAWILYLIVVGLAGYLSAFYLMPHKKSQDTFVKGSSKAEAIDVFEIQDDLTPVEKASGPAALFILFVLIPFLLQKEKTDTDIIGVFMIFIVFASFIKLQFFTKTS